jgi:hypothetical protein
MLARVRQDYAAGAVMAFSGREYVRSEWREVPAGFEEQARNHELLEIQPSLDEIRAHGPKAPGLGNPAPTAVTVETEEPTATPEPETPTAVTAETEETPVEETKPAEEDASSRTPRSRHKRAAGE